MPEMNGHWNAYCAYTKSGRSKGRCVLHYGVQEGVRAHRACSCAAAPPQASTRNSPASKLPPVSRDLPAVPAVRIVWNPQGYGSPDLPGQLGAGVLPRRPLRGRRRERPLLHPRQSRVGGRRAACTSAHPSKPYAFAEWGLWGLDAPSFIEEMARFVRTHRRVELVSYYSGKRGSPWDLASKPRSRAAYKRLISPLGR